MRVKSQKKVCVIDGQGGGIGSIIIKKLKERFEERIEVLALGTNAIATAQMLKAKANKGASGTNAINDGRSDPLDGRSRMFCRRKKNSSAADPGKSGNCWGEQSAPASTGR